MHIKSVLFSFLVFAISSCSARPAMVDTGRLKPFPEHEKVAKAVTEVLETYHYKKPQLNDSLSNLIFDRYFKDLDNNKSYFLKSDVEEFSKYRNQIGHYLEDGDVSVPFAIFNRFAIRQKERLDYVFTLLNDSLRTNTNQQYEEDREKSDWISTKDDLDKYWKKRIEFELLSLDMAKKDHKKNIANLVKRYQTFQKQSSKSNNEDVFQIFMNAFVTAIDPHSMYFSPNKRKEFAIEMSKSLEGIGATLTSENDYIKVASLTKGGPAEKSKMLSPTDRILAVAQGKSGEFVDIIGWRTDDAVQLIRGPKGTTVRLKILASNASSASAPRIVELVRDKINLVDQRATTSIEKLIRNGITYKIGIITLGDFYLDFDAAQHGDKNYNTTSRDLHQILDSLKRQNVDGVVVDLRNNGGGSLKEAIESSGLFIKRGPVVQVKDMNGKVEVDEDRNPEQVYAGPLAVLVNTFSASASEIFAGAIQDYGRGVIIGEQTYGKGTVQTAFNLGDLLPGMDKPLGQLNLTIAKFYRINGSSTQLKGVMPDIEFPNTIPREKFGEESESSALPWDQIQSSHYEMAGNIPQIKNKLVDLHNKRMDGSPYFKEWLENVEDLKIAFNRKTVVLNQKALEKVHETEEKKDFERYNVLRQLSGLNPIPRENSIEEGDSTVNPPTKTSAAKINKPFIRTPIDPELLIKKEGLQVIADIVDIDNPKKVSAIKNTVKVLQ